MKTKSSATLAWKLPLSTVLLAAFAFGCGSTSQEDHQASATGDSGLALHGDVKAALESYLETRSAGDGDESLPFCKTENDKTKCRVPAVASLNACHAEKGWAVAKSGDEAELKAGVKASECAQLLCQFVPGGFDLELGQLPKATVALESEATAQSESRVSSPVSSASSDSSLKNELSGRAEVSGPQKPLHVTLPKTGEWVCYEASQKLGKVVAKVDQTATKTEVKANETSKATISAAVESKAKVDSEASDEQDGQGQVGTKADASASSQTTVKQDSQADGQADAESKTTAESKLEGESTLGL